MKKLLRLTVSGLAIQSAGGGLINGARNAQNPDSMSLRVNNNPLMTNEPPSPPIAFGTNQWTAQAPDAPPEEVKQHLSETEGHKIYQALLTFHNSETSEHPEAGSSPSMHWIRALLKDKEHLASITLEDLDTPSIPAKDGNKYTFFQMAFFNYIGPIVENARILRTDPTNAEAFNFFLTINNSMDYHIMDWLLKMGVNPDANLEPLSNYKSALDAFQIVQVTIRDNISKAHPIKQLTSLEKLIQRLPGGEAFQPINTAKNRERYRAFLDFYNTLNPSNYAHQKYHDYFGRLLDGLGNLNVLPLEQLNDPAIREADGKQYTLFQMVFSDYLNTINKFIQERKANSNNPQSLSLFKTKTIQYDIIQLLLNFGVNPDANLDKEASYKAALHLFQKIEPSFHEFKELETLIRQLPGGESFKPPKVNDSTSLPQELAIAGATTVVCLGAGYLLDKYTKNASGTEPSENKNGPPNNPNKKKSRRTKTQQVSVARCDSKKEPEPREKDTKSEIEINESQLATEDEKRKAEEERQAISLEINKLKTVIDGMKQNVTNFHTKLKAADALPETLDSLNSFNSGLSELNRHLHAQKLSQEFLDDFKNKVNTALDNYFEVVNSALETYDKRYDEHRDDYPQEMEDFIKASKKQSAESTLNSHKSNVFNYLQRAGIFNKTIHHLSLKYPSSSKSAQKKEDQLRTQAFQWLDTYRKLLTYSTHKNDAAEVSGEEKGEKADFLTRTTEALKIARNPANLEKIIINIRKKITKLLNSHENKIRNAFKDMQNASDNMLTYFKLLHFKEEEENFVIQKETSLKEENGKIATQLEKLLQNIQLSRQNIMMCSEVGESSWKTCLAELEVHLQKVQQLHKHIIKRNRDHQSEFQRIESELKRAEAAKNAEHTPLDAHPMPTVPLKLAAAPTYENDEKKCVEDPADRNELIRKLYGILDSTVLTSENLREEYDKFLAEFKYPTWYDLIDHQAFILSKMKLSCDRKPPDLGVIARHARFLADIDCQIPNIDIDDDRGFILKAQQIMAEQIQMADIRDVAKFLAALAKMGISWSDLDKDFRNDLLGQLEILLMHDVSSIAVGEDQRLNSQCSAQLLWAFAVTHHNVKPAIEYSEFEKGLLKKLAIQCGIDWSIDPLDERVDKNMNAKRLRSDPREVFCQQLCQAKVLLPDLQFSNPVNELLEQYQPKNHRSPLEKKIFNALLSLSEKYDFTIDLPTLDPDLKHYSDGEITFSDGTKAILEVDGPKHFVKDNQGELQHNVRTNIRNTLYECKRREKPILVISYFDWNKLKKERSKETREKKFIDLINKGLKHMGKSLICRDDTQAQASAYHDNSHLFTTGLAQRTQSQAVNPAFNEVVVMADVPPSREAQAHGI